jgi:hypothetical protein
MRRLILAFTAAAVLLAASAVCAAPTCQDQDGDTVRCGAAGAMPVGWSPTPQQLFDRRMSGSPGPSATTVFGLICFVGGLFALIALLPDFDGRRSSDWDRQEGDDD